MSPGARRLDIQFARCERGNVAMLFGLVIIGVLGAVALAVDTSRQVSTSSNIQALLDSVALSLAPDAASLTPAQLSERAQGKYEAIATDNTVRGMQVKAVYSSSPTKMLRVTVAANIPTTFGNIFGIKSLPVSAIAEVPLGSRPAQVVLVLDNTGSMSGNSKLTELKKASKNLVSAMQTAATGSGNDIRISLVPFAKSVNVGTANASAPWLNWSGFKQAQSQWNGCVDDRDMPNDANNILPNDEPATQYPASNCGLMKITPLSNNWGALKASIDQMTASGNTNLTIGLAWGFNMLTPGAPLSGASPEPEKYNHYMVLLTDGENTQNRWTTNPSTIDNRTLETCKNIKAAGIQIFSVRMINGNANLLKACASNANMYYDVKKAEDLNAVFDKIATSVKNALFLSR